MINNENKEVTKESVKRDCKKFKKALHKNTKIFKILASIPTVKRTRECECLDKMKPGLKCAPC